MQLQTIMVHVTLRECINLCSATMWNVKYRVASLLITADTGSAENVTTVVDTSLIRRGGVQGNVQSKGSNKMFVTVAFTMYISLRFVLFFPDI